MIPVRIHAIRSQPGDPSVLPMSAATMNTPEPIMLPATSMVASVSVMALTNSGFALAVGAAISDESYWPDRGYGRESRRFSIGPENVRPGRFRRIRCIVRIRLGYVDEC